MRKKYTIKCYSDPGHGWAKVSKKFLHKLGIYNLITPWSYERGEYAYLEEDTDMTLLFNTLKDKGIELKFDEHHTNKTSRIRKYDSFRCEEAIV